MKTVLHTGCGPKRPNALPEMFPHREWDEIRLDLNPQVRPDYIADITDMPIIHTASVDAVFSPHNLEHLYAHQVPSALKEFKRVLRPGGFAVIVVPDLQLAAELISKGQSDKKLQDTKAGPVTPLDIVYGLRGAVEHKDDLLHKTGFTAETLRAALEQAGFARIQVNREPRGLSLWAQAVKDNRPTQRFGE